MIVSVPREVVLAVFEFIFKVQNPKDIQSIDIDLWRVAITEYIRDENGQCVAGRDGEIAQRTTIIPITN